MVCGSCSAYQLLVLLLLIFQCFHGCTHNTFSIIGLNCYYFVVILWKGRIRLSKHVTFLYYILFMLCTICICRKYAFHFLFCYVNLSLNWVLDNVLQKCSDHRVTDKKTYRTFARTLPPSSKVSKSVVALLKEFKWNKIMLVMCHLKKDRWHKILIDAFTVIF